MKIRRFSLSLLEKKTTPGKVVLLYGARRTGKTTLLQEFQKKHSGTQNILFVNGEDRVSQQIFSSQSIEQLRNTVGKYDILIIDEAQVIPNIGLNLKLIVDHISHVSVIASGSASFDLINKTGEPLTGRKKSMWLFPVSVSEIVETQDVLYQQQMLEQQLRFGMYPEIFQLHSEDEKKEYLEELVQSYLLKDILSLEQVRNPKTLMDLLTLLSFQIGMEVSASELSNSLGIHKTTVFRYLDLLEKVFVIKNIRGLSRNLRKEVSKTSRYYFYDVGIRNAIIRNFQPLALRNDQGMLFENFIVMELIKNQDYTEKRAHNYFWRTYDQKEIDFVAERDGAFNAYEVKWAQNKAPKPPKEFLEAYPNTSFVCVNRENYTRTLLA